MTPTGLQIDSIPSMLSFFLASSREKKRLLKTSMFLFPSKCVSLYIPNK